MSEGRVAGFSVHLENFDGPFDLLLQLISRHRMDITDVAIATVTDEFITYIRELEKTETGWKLDHASEFVVVAATLLDLKAARLLPSGQIDDEEDLALLEARDLLFARLLQYRAFKEIASILSERIFEQEKTFARSVSLEPVFAALLPEVLIGVTPERFAAIANRVLTPKSAPTLSVEHLHLPLVSVAAEALAVVSALRRHKTMSFRALVSDAENTLVVVARFLALLELFKEGSVRFEQVIALGELQITWVGSVEGEIKVSDEFDRPALIESGEDGVEGGGDNV
ncbi:MAG: segregation and condensation protein A [Actinobacteria bacterium BACL2 MAG-121001-bin67]|uniref:Segregation and condensation protein A n=5 Tax=ac1 cluster TaxID=1655545 RepID=A0A0R2P558_9ACTN|nr:MAG: segregation and condensation protein A [Actinobacteria bacterium BACL2 MAG-120802-bin41]KRO32807.1 MAG: segregation and condensation protein A [Actinobacteria bacterium BACL2 MAG-121220-bin52]KRO33118.1 MAG: segregation and condensation protein A [Actinobacteria bacterium BACL2 MAG-121001-bin67]KRO45142.1 MAG: segregation and condensation protein A [Actinobacteria bacterium BACL2 MAG-120813-bin23]KRO53653.1 MAG: segregation and condensation protein A [Actinobacteria bacterium BACL2 MAG-